MFSFRVSVCVAVVEREATEEEAEARVEVKRTVSDLVETRERSRERFVLERGLFVDSE